MRRVSILTLTAAALVMSQGAARGADAEPLPSTKVTPSVTVFEVGSNTTVLVTDEGKLVVDSGVTDNATKLVDALKALGPQPVHFLVNTHHHFDHVGGNETVGAGATILAHANAKDPSKEKGPANETFTDERELKLGGEVVRLLHLGRGHTSGDTVVAIESQKVLATGDLFFNGLPPYIDVAAGADTASWIRVIATLAERYPDYKVVPGHGPVTDMAHYQKFAAYLKALREQVAAAIAAGKTREQAQESVTLAEFSGIKDNDFLSKKANVGWVYDELTKKQ